MKKEKILIFAYVGAGKTEAEKRYKNVIDLESHDYIYTYDKSIAHWPLEKRKGNANLRTINPEYPTNFINATLLALETGKLVLTTFVEHAFNSLTSEEFKSQAPDVRVILVCPEYNNFEEYADRFRARGNSENVVVRRRTEHDLTMNLFKNAKSYEKIIIQPGQFLDDALIKYGIKLESR